MNVGDVKGWTESLEWPVWDVRPRCKKKNLLLIIKLLIVNICCN